MSVVLARIDRHPTVIGIDFPKHRSSREMVEADMWHVHVAIISLLSLCSDAALDLCKFIDHPPFLTSLYTTERKT